MSIRQAHLINYRLEPVFDKLAAGAIVLGLVVSMPLVADLMDSMVGAFFCCCQIGPTLAPKESLVM